MLSRSDMGDSQETSSSGSAFRGDGSDTEVVEEMYETTEQMGEGDLMCRHAEARGLSAFISFFTRVDESARCCSVSDESKRVQDDGKCSSYVVASTQLRADLEPDDALLSTEEEPPPGRFLLPPECSGEDD
ncbi:hypothetical protein ACE6H2_026336 [Prunus campanulata]